MKIIAGLGNPGAEYTQTKHNVGFILVDALAQRLGVSAWKKAFSSLVAEVRIGSEKVFLVKPQTYMNLSGQSVQAVASFYKIQPQEILVIHDELDLEPGRIKFKLGGGNGGHNGLKDIQARLGSPDFYRLRLGIGHPGDRNEVVNYVLKKPRREEKELIEDAIDKSIATLPDILAGKIEAAQRVLHGK